MDIKPASLVGVSFFRNAFINNVGISSGGRSSRGDPAPSHGTELFMVLFKISSGSKNNGPSVVVELLESIDKEYLKGNVATKQ
jgi:hypothetical protein